jgi:heterotetrameric sarcosine oxidase gamma subunit
MTARPIRQTALAAWHESAGARMAEFRGWNLPASFGDPHRERARVVESAGLCDASWIARLDLKGPGLDTPLAVPHGHAWKLGRGHILVTCEPQERAAVVASLDAPRAQTIYLTDVTSVYAQFLLAGPRSRDVLRKLTSLNVSGQRLPDLACTQTSLAHAHAIVLREDARDLPAFHLLVGRDYAQSVWESVLHAGHEFAIAAFGTEALAALRAGAV